MNYLEDLGLGWAWIREVGLVFTLFHFCSNVCVPASLSTWETFILSILHWICLSWMLAFGGGGGGLQPYSPSPFWVLDLIGTWLGLGLGGVGTKGLGTGLDNSSHNLDIPFTWLTMNNFMQCKTISIIPGSPRNPRRCAQSVWPRRPINPSCSRTSTG